MNAQEIFDTVCDHLYTQGVRSMNDNKCLYRGPNGTKCAVGCLIDDDEYDPLMDSPMAFDELLDATDDDGVRKYSTLDRFRRHRGLLTDLQEVHDNPGNWRSSPDMRQALVEVAKNHSLSPAHASGSFRDR